MVSNMAIPPCLTRCDEHGLTEYYEAILAATSKPLIVQDASGYVGHSISIQTQGNLFRRYPDRIMFKPEAIPIGPKLSALREATNGQAKIFEGTGGLALIDSYQRGVTGTMPGTDVCWALVAIWRSLESGDHERARRIHEPLAVMVSMQTSLDAFLAIEKMLLVEQGVFKNAIVRRPVGYRLDEETRLEVLRLFDRLRRAVDH